MKYKVEWKQQEIRTQGRWSFAGGLCDIVDL